MSSACSNPLLYGWLNENFKKEFRLLFSQCTSSAFVDCICRLKGSSSSSSTPSAAQRSLPGSIKQKADKKLDIIRDTSSSREIETLNSTSNQAFNFYSNESKNLPLNGSSMLNSSTSILDSRPNINQYAKRESIDEHPTEQLTELTSAQTDQTEQITSQSEFSSNLDALNSSSKAVGGVNANIVHSTLTNDIVINCSNCKSSRMNSDSKFTPNSTSSTMNDEKANLHQFIRQTYFKPNDLNLNESTDQTLYLNSDQNLDENEEFNEKNKCTKYLSRTDAII